MWYITAQLAIMYTDSSCRCNDQIDCLNGAVDEQSCDPNNTYITIVNTRLSLSILCDDVCNFDDCEDEAICNGYR